MSELFPSAGRWLVAGLVLLAVGMPLAADTISLAWDPVTHPTLSGYRVYYGTSSNSYTQTQDTGTTTQVVLNGLTSCTDYFISVKAVSSDGSESSLFSNEVTGWPRPIVTQAAPAALERGTAQQVTLTGANYRNGISVSVSNPGVSVSNLSVDGCNQLTMTLTATAGATLGAFDIQVTDATGVVGTGAAVGSVTADTNAPQLSALQASAVGSTTATISWTTDEPADGRVFYREVGETAYQVSALNAALTTAHSVGLNGLTPSTSYEYYVESADSNGNVANANGPSDLTTSANGFTYMRFEAEAGPLSAPAETANASDAFSGGYMQLAQGTANGTAGNPSGSWDYGFSTTSAATWHVWVRSYGVNGNANEWFESVDGAAMASVSPTQNGVWEWAAARSYTLSAGQHTLTLGGAEARARVDRILITDDPSFVPSEQPGSDNSAPASASNLTAAEDDGSVTLGWTNPSDGDLDRIVVRFRDDGVMPVSIYDGQPLVDRAASPGADGETHSGLTNGTTMSYAVFALDDRGNASAVASIVAIPQAQAQPPAQVQNLRRTDNQ